MNLKNRLPLLAVILTSVFCIAISIFSLKSGQFIIFQNIFYLPIIVACFYYGKRGFAVSVALSCIYFFLIIAFTNDPMIIRDALIRVILFIIIAAVITSLSIARARAEASLVKEREKFRTVADYTYDWEYWTEPQQKMLYVSPSCERISGYRPEDFMVESGLIYEVVHPDDRDIFKCHADHYHKLQIDSVGEIVFRIVNRNGETLWIAHLCQPVYSNDGQFLGRRASNRDISDRKRTEETLRETKNYLESLIDHANAPIIVWNPQFQIIRFNHAFEFLTGRTAADVIGKHLEILFPPDLVDSSMERVKNTPLGEHWESVEISILNTGGTVHTVLWNSATIFATDGMTPVATIAQGHDITVRKRMEGEQAKLEAQNRQLQKVESLSRMAGAIAHHFNNNLGAVIGNLEMVIDDLPKSDGHANILTEAMQSAWKAAEMSSLMLTYLGQSSGKRESLDLSETCLRGLPILRTVMPGTVMVKTELPSPGPVISANADQIQQVLTNLVTNAWESVNDKIAAIHLCVKTVFATEIPTAHRYPVGWQPQNTAYACLEVTDTGNGIADKDIEKIFDPFFSSKFTGRGMGLAAVLGVVRAHGGSATVESVLGRGSIFRVFFPISTEKFLRQPDKAAQPLSIKRGGTVLLIEDEEIVRNMAAAMLKRLGFTVLAAKDGVEALEIFRQRRDEICLVFSDLTMPHMDGWETLTALRKLAPNIPVILASGYDKAHVMAGDHPELPQTFLDKPYKLKGLSDAISQALVGRK